MQVLCWSSDESVETLCSVCGRGFVLYWDGHTQTQKAEALQDMVKALKNHQCAGKTVEEQAAEGSLVTA